MSKQAQKAAESLRNNGAVTTGRELAKELWRAFLAKGAVRHANRLTYGDRQAVFSPAKKDMIRITANPIKA